MLDLTSLILLIFFCQTFGDGIDSPGDALSSSGIKQAAISFVKKYLKIASPMGVRYISGYRNSYSKITYAYVRQTYVSFSVRGSFMAHPLIL